jgi:hypothetical protein
MLGATARTGSGQWAGEIVATFGLVATILACVRFRKDAVPYAVGLYITSAYWFTSSTSFANPAASHWPPPQGEPAPYWTIWSAEWPRNRPQHAHVGELRRDQPVPRRAISTPAEPGG